MNPTPYCYLLEYSTQTHLHSVVPLYKSFAGYHKSPDCSDHPIETPSAWTIFSTQIEACKALLMAANENLKEVDELQERATHALKTAENLKKSAQLAMAQMNEQLPNDNNNPGTKS